MSYYIAPLTLSGFVSHTQPLQAALSGSPSIPTGFTIEWRKNGATVKTGPTSNSFNLAINTAADLADQVNGVVFTANDAGAYIDFDFTDMIDPITLLPVTSQGVILSNQLPVISGAGLITDAYSRTSGRPTVIWTFTDADGDPQYAYRVRFGTSPGGADLYDTGITLANAATTFSVTVPNSITAFTAGSLYYWTIDVTDGQTINPLDPSSPLILVTASGTGIVNTPPVISNVLIDGVTGGATIQDLAPVITWTYSDVDGQPEQSYRVIVAQDIGLTNILWDSGPLVGAATSAVYNFNLTGLPIIPHVILYVGVTGNDTFVSSATATGSFIIAIKPQITALFVDTKINPLNVKETTPTFNWRFNPPDDILTAYDIRVGDSNVDLGTDAFAGNIWNPGLIVTPESYSTLFNFDGSAFGLCADTKNLIQGVRYYFQVLIQDGFQTSDWAVGFFQLNNPPIATNVQILPAAPFNNDDLNVTYDFIDDIGDTEDLNQTQIKWFSKSPGGAYQEVTSLRNQRLAPSSLTTPGDQWQFTVRVSDGTAFSLLTYTSPPVTIQNRPPVASALTILPSQPRTSDNLQAIFSLSDPDEDPVVASINWFKNELEQTALRNTKTIPSSVTNVGETWYFTVLPNDGYVNGPLATSQSVTIQNTAPVITSMSIDGSILPHAVDDPNPTISWTYQDADGQGQQKYEVLLGTRPVRTTQFFSSSRDLTGAAAGIALACNGQDGVISTAKNGVAVVSGDEILDSGIITSDAMSFQYITQDFIKPLTLTTSAFENLTGYTLAADLQTLALNPEASSGTAFAKFTGQDSFYNVELTYIKENTKTSTYRLIVDGIAVSQFTSQIGTGSNTYLFNAVKISSTSSVGIAGIATDVGAKAQFTKLSFTPITQFAVNAGDFKTLSGYLQDGTGGVKLASLAGTGTTPFSFPTGTYNIEFVYVTETNGNPTATFSINNNVLLSFVYESGAMVRSRFLTGVTINQNDVLKFTGSRNGGAAARIKKVIFTPTDTVKVGAKLQDGITYFASVRVFDGLDWSDWHSTKFTMAGSAWASNVSNARGWTIEARFSVFPNGS